ncbi:MAG: VOC family protein [Pseudomonadota bacterium]
MLKKLGVSALLCMLVACSTVTVELPAINSGESRDRQPGSFVWHDLISDDPEGSVRFYSRLFGWQFSEFSPLNGRYWTISHRGRAIGGMVAQDSLPAQRDISQWVSLLSVADPDAARSVIVDAGGEVLREPVALGPRGTVAVYADPKGAIFATVTSPTGDPEAMTSEGDFLWHELWTSSVQDAVGFYAALSDRVSAEQVYFSDPVQTQPDYQLLVRSGVALAGVRSLPADDLPSLWMPFLRVTSEERLRSMLERVSQLGGEVLVPATARPAEGFLAVIAGPLRCTDCTPHLGRLDGGTP